MWVAKQERKYDLGNFKIQNKFRTILSFHGVFFYEVCFLFAPVLFMLPLILFVDYGDKMSTFNRIK